MILRSHRHPPDRPHTSCTLYQYQTDSSVRPVYTHYSVAGAKRIDRIYDTRELICKKQGMETIAVVCTDHLAVCLRLTVDVPIVRLRHGFWKMDNALLDDNTITEQLRSL